MAITSTGDNDGQDKKKKKRKTRGRQKIEIKKIQKKSNLHVTFSKRRNGLMKKASEISVLCGAEVALVALSPEEKKVFAFGHPDLESVLARHTNQSLSGNSHKSKQAATASIEKLKMEYEESLQKLQEEKKKADDREELKKGSENTAEEGFWWEEPIDDMGLQELEDYKNALLQLRRNAACKLNQRHGDSCNLNSLVAGDISDCPHQPPHPPQAWSSPKLPRWTTDSGIPKGFCSF